MTFNEEGVDIFFPDKGQDAYANEAKALCFGCPVFYECRDYRERTGTGYGVWAGEVATQYRRKTK